MKGINKEMSISQIISMHPEARSVFKRHGISFIGKDVSPLESLEKVCFANNLSEDGVKNIINDVNEEIQKQEKYQTKLIHEGFIKLTPKAAENLRKLLAAKPEKNGIRLRLVSSGCSLYQYDMDFGTKAIENEVFFTSNNVIFYIEKKTASMLKGLEIDYIEEKGGFLFKNPNVKE